MQITKHDLDHYTVKDLSGELKIPLSTIYTWIEKGKLCAIKLGGKILIPKRERARIEELLNPSSEK